jgi:hypothetical protein
MRAVVLGVMTARLGMVLLGLAGMAMGAVGMVRRLLVIAGLVMPGGLAMVLCRMLVVLGSLVMMVDVCVVAHVSLPV